MKFIFKVDGSETMAAALRAARARMEAATAKAVYLAGNAVMTDAKQRAPLDLGTLRASGYVTLPKPGPHPKVEVGFGGSAADYALVQHEHTEYHHEVGEAKYLQKAFNSVNVKAIIEKSIKSDMESGTKPQLSPGRNRTEPE